MVPSAVMADLECDVGVSGSLESTRISTKLATVVIQAISDVVVQALSSKPS